LGLSDCDPRGQATGDFERRCGEFIQERSYKTHLASLLGSINDHQTKLMEANGERLTSYCASASTSVVENVTETLEVVKYSLEEEGEYNPELGNVLVLCADKGMR
jgi:hypothetical protein